MNENVVTQSTLCQFQQLRDMGFDVSILVIALFACAIDPFLYCYFGKMTTECYANMADRLFESSWQQLPIDIQKMFILLIGNMHIPVYYHGFSILTLNLETFCVVSMTRRVHFGYSFIQNYDWSKETDVFQLFRTIITCYMMFKAIA